MYVEVRFTVTTTHSRIGIRSTSNPDHTIVWNAVGMNGNCGKAQGDHRKAYLRDFHGTPPQALSQIEQFNSQFLSRYALVKCLQIKRLRTALCSYRRRKGSKL